MELFASAIRLWIILSISILLGTAAFAQEPGHEMRNDRHLPPVTSANTPKPEPAQQAILGLFDKYEVVAMNAAHENKDLDDFILALLRNPELLNKINDIEVECGNSLYQPILDRYIAGEDVPVTEVQQVWRKTTQDMCGLSAFYEEFFPLVRQINKKLPAEKKLRVLAGDPPIDWSKFIPGSEVSTVGMDLRDTNIASVMEKEVLSKHHKALMLFGMGHIFHGGPTAVAGIEKDYPHPIYVIGDYYGLPHLAAYRNELEKRMASWPVPSLANNKGTWLAELGTRTDGFLYLGRFDLTLFEHIPANIVLDKDYMDELQRVAARSPRGGGLYGMGKANPELFDESDFGAGVCHMGPNGPGPDCPKGEKPPSQSPPTRQPN